MKKLLSLLLALVFVCTSFALVSCNPDDPSSLERLAGKTPEELYSLYQENFEAATSYTVNGTQKISISYPGQSVNMTQTVEGIIAADSVYMKTENNITPMINMEMWFIEDTLYMSMAGEKIRLEIDREQFMEEYMTSNPADGTFVEMPEDWFDGIKFEKEEESWALTFVLKAEDFAEYFGDLGLDGEIVGDVTHKIYFDEDGNLEKQHTSLDMNIEGVSAHVESTVIITVGDATVTPPEDADSYLSTVDPDQF